MFYLTMHSTHFNYDYMPSDIMARTIQIARGNPLSPLLGLSFPLSTKSCFIWMGWYIPQPLLHQHHEHISVHNWKESPNPPLLYSKRQPHPNPIINSDSDPKLNLDTKSKPKPYTHDQ